MASSKLRLSFVSLAEQVTLLQTQNNSLRQEVEVLTVEMGFVLDWIGETLGASIVNKNSAHYKSVHGQNLQRESVKRSLAPEATEDEEPEEGEDALEVAKIKEPPNSDSAKAAPEGPEKRSSAVQSTIRIPMTSSKIPVTQAAIPHNDGHHRRTREGANSSGSFRLKTVANKKVKKPTAKPYQCQFCQKSFAHAYSKQIHERGHTGERPYQCGFCDKSFATSGNRIRHEMTHTGERPYQCRYCMSTFALALTRKNHELIHTGEKPYCCEYCKKGFRTQFKMSVHLRVHTGERPYICQICGSSYTASKQLRVHERVHA